MRFTSNRFKMTREKSNLVAAYSCEHARGSRRCVHVMSVSEEEVYYGDKPVVYSALIYKVTEL